MTKKRKTVTVPKVYDPPGKAPPETLAYLSPAEHEMIRRMTDGTASRGPKSVPSYAVTGNSWSGMATAGNTPGTTTKSGTGSSSSTTRASVSTGVVGQRSGYGGGGGGSRPLTAPNGSYYGPKGGNALNQNARFAAARSVGFNPPAVRRTLGDAEMLGRMMMAESGNIRNAKGGVNTSGLQGVAEVARNRMLSSRFPDTVPGVLNQRKQFSPMWDGSYARTAANPMATRVAESVLSGESPPIVGTALNYGNLHTINNMPGYSSAATRQAFNSMRPTLTIADARNPTGMSHTFGTIGKPSDVAFNVPAARPALASAAPAADEERQAPLGYFSQFALNDDDINRMKSEAMKEFGFGQLMEMNKNIGALPGFMGPITRDQRAVAAAASQTPTRVAAGTLTQPYNVPPAGLRIAAGTYTSPYNLAAASAPQPRVAQAETDPSMWQGDTLTKANVQMPPAAPAPKPAVARRAFNRLPEGTHGGAAFEPPRPSSDPTADATSLDQLVALQSRMLAAGASPEELAFVAQLISQKRSA